MCLLSEYVHTEQYVKNIIFNAKGNNTKQTQLKNNSNPHRTTLKRRVSAPLFGASIKTQLYSNTTYYRICNKMSSFDLRQEYCCSLTKTCHIRTVLKFIWGITRPYYSHVATLKRNNAVIRNRDAVLSGVIILLIFEVACISKFKP